MRVSNRLSGTNNKTTDSINGILLEYLRACCLLREESTVWDYQFIMQPVKMRCHALWWADTNILEEPAASILAQKADHMAQHLRSHNLHSHYHYNVSVIMHSACSSL